MNAYFDVLDKRRYQNGKYKLVDLESKQHKRFNFILEKAKGSEL